MRIVGNARFIGKDGRFRLRYGLLAVSAAVVAAMGSSALGQASSAINVGGWNVNDIFGTPTLAGQKFGPVDCDNNITWYAAGTPGSPGGGLPTANNRTFTSAANSNTNFQFNPYNGLDNALELTGAGTGPLPQILNGTLALGAPTSYNSISILSASANGSPAISYTLNFAGGVTASGTIQGQDWFGGSTNVAISNIGRVGVAAGNFDSVSTNPKMYENDIAIPVADTNLALQSVSFSIPAAAGFTQWSLMGISGARTVSPIAISGGFNQKMIIPATAPQAGATSTISATMDNGTGNLNGGNNTWYEKGYNTSAPTTGLPVSGSTFTSQANAADTFQMQSYSANDAVLLNSAAGNTAGTLTLASGTSAYNTLSFLTASGHGPSVFSLTINYSDGAPATTISSVSSPDWFSSGQVAWTANGRAAADSVGNTVFNNVNSGLPHLFQQDVALPDTIDPISSVQMNYVSGGNIAVFAMSGSAQSVFSYDGSDPTTPATFDTASSNFKTGVTTTAFGNGVVALFDDTATGSHTVTVAAGGVNPAGVVFNTSTGYTINGTGAITGIGGMNLNGHGSVTLNNSNTYTGNTAINAGTLNIGATGAVASNNVTVASGGILNVLAGGQLTSPALNLTSNGTSNLNTTLAVSSLNGNGAVNIPTSGTTLTMKDGSFSGTITGNNSTFNLSYAGSSTFYTFSGAMSDGVGPLSMVLSEPKAWPADIVIPNANNYSGGTTLAAGLVRVGNGASLGTGPITFTGGTLGSSGPVTVTNQFVFDQTHGINIDVFNPITFTSPIALAAGSTPIKALNFADVTVTNGVLAGVISGPGSLNLTGYFDITGTNTYSGGTTLNSSTDIATNNSSAFGSGTITFNNGGVGTMVSAPSSGFTIPNNFNFGANANAFFENYHPFIMSGNGNLGTGATLNVYTLQVTLSGVISGGGLALAAGSNVLELSNPNNTFTGPIVVNATNVADGAAGTLQIDNPGSLGAAASITVQNGGSLLVNDNSGSAGLVGPSQTPASVSIVGAGVTSTYPGPTTNGPTGALRGADGATSTWAGNVVLAGAADIASGKDGTFILTGSISGTGPLTLVGNPGDVGSGANIILSPSNGNSNTYSGETQVKGELDEFDLMQLQIGADNGISPNSGLNIIISGSTGPVIVDLNGHNQSVQYLTGVAQGQSDITNNAGGTSILTINNGNIGALPASLSTAIQGGIAVVKTGAGNQILAGANSYTGGTKITGGTLTAASSTALGTAAVTLNGGTLSLAAPANPSGFTVQSVGNDVVAALGTSSGIQLAALAGSVATSIGNLTLNTGSTINLTNIASGGTHGALVVSSLNIANSGGAWTGKLDLGNSDLIAKATLESTIFSQLKSGFAAGTGYWNGQGIASSSAAADTRFLTTLGYRTGGSTFDGVSTSSNDVIVKYTYYGDADLNGTVNGADYQQIDLGFGSHLTGWSNGDFNYDGVVNGSDFALIDNTFNQLTANPGLTNPLSIIASPAAVGAVPEPTALGVLALGALGLMARRRRRL